VTLFDCIKMASSFNLFHLTVQPPTAISSAVVGNFSAPNSHEFAVARGGFLEILKRDDKSSNRLQTLHREQAFGLIRGIATVRLSGHHRDLIIVSSDSGRLAFLKFVSKGTEYALERLSCETYGKFGIRRSIPGQYLAVDPEGRAVMISSVEKDKLVFVTNRDAQDQLFVSSPLEAHKSNSITFAIAGLNVGFDNPIFAAIEASYYDGTDGADKGEKEGAKQVVFYEVDLGLNHVVRKSSKSVRDSANLLVAVPHGGVLVCSSDEIEWTKPGNENSIKVRLPKREADDLERDVLVISSATFQTKDVFFALLQTERGDVFKVSVVFEKEKPKEILVKYFDTVIPSVQLCISKDGLLFAASEFGNHELYQFKSIGDSEGDTSVQVSSNDDSIKTFSPRSTPLNLELFDTPKSLAPILSFKVADIAKDGGVNQIYALCGRGERSASMKVLRQGLSVLEMATLRLPKADTRGVFTIRDGDDCDKFIVVSFSDTTRVFSARTEDDDGETAVRDIIEEDIKTNFVRDAATLCASAWGTAGLKNNNL
jgi:splicing factor 3B subunit 3